jgi:orotidine-5'-phosphate decarboxylase
VDRKSLFEQIKHKKSFLCVGLDSELGRLPKHLLDENDPVFAFNKAIIDATAPHAVAYKPNTAFYEANGSKGWQSLEKTIAYLDAKHPEIFVIADAKRGDIGNTSSLYARAFFQNLGVDAVTVAPYMGHDSIKPFLGYDQKWVILLALTSNSGSADFQYFESNTDRLFERVIKQSREWANADQLMFVVGATHPEELAQIRNIVPDYFFLVPGVGAQGGDLAAVCKAGFNQQCGLLVNASRSILYASSGVDFAEKAGEEAAKLHLEMQQQLLRAGMI